MNLKFFSLAVAKSKIESTEYWVVNQESFPFACARHSIARYAAIPYLAKELARPYRD